ncbi:MAG: hypothetical protein V4563_17175 [Pseudomonadota bacterium]
MSLMPQTPFQWFVSATTGTGLVPADGYFAKFYAAGTAIPKAIYIDPELNVPYPSPSNVAVLDADGRALIYLGAGGYKLVICKPDDTPVYTQDNIAGENSFGTGFVDSFADLLNVNTTLNKYTYIGGYYAPGDGGDGMFYNNTSSDAADGGYVQDSTFDNTKRWFRIPDESGKVRSASFGAIGLSVNRTDAMLAADAYAASQGLTLLVNVFTRVNDMTFAAPSVEFVEGAFIRGFAAATVTFNGIVSGSDSTIFSHSLGGGLDVILANPSQVSNPYWFEASPTQSAGNNATSFSKWKAAGAGVFVVPAGDWPHTGDFNPVADRLTLLYGSVGDRVPGTFYGPPSLISGSVDIDTTGDITADVFNGTAITVANDVNAGNVFAVGSVSGAQVYGENFLVSASGYVSAATTVSAGENVTAGVLGAGTLNARAGTSTSVYRASGCLFNVIGAGTGTIGAASLTADGDSIKIIAAGTFTGSATNFVTKITVGGQDVLTSGGGTIVGSGGSYYMEVTVSRTSATTASCVGFINWTNGPTERQSVPYSGTANITWANSNAVASTTSGTGTSATQTSIRGEIFPI